jgi:hypothetical protein
MRKFVLLFAAVFVLLGCGESYDRQVDGLERYLKRKGPIGSATDYWLVGGWGIGVKSRTALIFGYVDNGEFCNQVAKLHMEKYPADEYWCEPVQ